MTNLEMNAVSNGENITHSNNDLASKIIYEFLCELEKSEGYNDVAQNLKSVILNEKFTEAEVTTAMFGEEKL